MGKVISMAEHAQDNTYINIDQMLVESLAERGAGTLDGKHAMLLVLDKGPDGDRYTTRWRAANMRRSEMIALLEAISHRLKSELIGG